jgi:hypothetical protein
MLPVKYFTNSTTFKKKLMNRLEGGIGWTILWAAILLSLCGPGVSDLEYRSQTV